jgi:hypothetical protein
MYLLIWVNSTKWWYFKMYNCYKCSKQLNLQSIAAHITVNHFEAALKCGEEGCGRPSDNPISFRKHLKTYYINVQHQFEK